MDFSLKSKICLIANEFPLTIDALHAELKDVKYFVEIPADGWLAGSKSSGDVFTCSQPLKSVECLKDFKFN